MEVERIAPDPFAECQGLAFKSTLVVVCQQRHRVVQGAVAEGVFYAGMSPVDRLLARVDHALRTLSGAVHAARPNPAGPLRGEELTPEDRRLAGALMRVNHVGEVCAQALYQAQALTARTEDLRRQMDRASREEGDHLAWTQTRLAELGERPSLLLSLIHI